MLMIHSFTSRLKLLKKRQKDRRNYERHKNMDDCEKIKTK